MLWADEVMAMVAIGSVAYSTFAYTGSKVVASVSTNEKGQRQRSESDCDLYVRWKGTQGAMAPPWSFRVGKVEEKCRAYPDLPIRNERLGTDCIRDRWHRFGQSGIPRSEEHARDGDWDARQSNRVW